MKTSFHGRSEFKSIVFKYNNKLIDLVNIFNLKNVIDKPFLSRSRMWISFRISLLKHGLSFSRINIVFEGIHALEI
jgi:hypothetical protein